MYQIKNNDLRGVVVTEAFLFLSTFFIQSAIDILTLHKANVNNKNYVI